MEPTLPMRARIGAGRVAQRMGCLMDNYYPKKLDDISEQRGILESVIERRPDAVILAPTHSMELNKTIRQAEKQIFLWCF